MVIGQWNLSGVLIVQTPVRLHLLHAVMLLHRDGLASEHIFSLIWKCDQLEGVHVLDQKQDLERTKHQLGTVRIMSPQLRCRVKTEDVKDIKPPA